MWVGSDGIEHECPHDKYGDRIPTYEDIRALVPVVEVLPLDEYGDKARALIGQVVASYCRQFRDVAGSEG